MATEMSAYDANELYEQYRQQVEEEGGNALSFSEWLRREDIVPSYRLSFKE